MSKGRINDFYIQYEQLTIKFEEQEKLLKETNKLVKSLNKTIETLNEAIEQLKKTNEEQAKEILRLKSKNDRDSSNSSKPSSTNGYKKVITNRREKSDKKQGAQKFHKPHSLNNKLEQFINSGDVEEKVIEINKNEANKNKRYIEKIVRDIKITKEVKRYRYYPDKNGKYNIPSGGLTPSKGRIWFNGHTETYYSQKVLPGAGLNIPGRHIASDGTIRDKDGYIVLASDDYPKGTVVETSLGAGKVYDSGSGKGNIDLYTDW